ncbi:cell volume regulation protein A [Deinococcus metalli]|uniref:Cell volume regulation protein A n=1 Tax=Deinococcus metalli TaxID=1141878 RepID=A0A7W8KHA5_9DEIO|nr:potassium/proton antiporter [Deinococcus metalli]MBB5377138.1 cell volume regulation protein A [Deinococcus metalli]GHF48711.1 K+/H+ antiporter [Deinococcus metalli]
MNHVNPIDLPVFLISVLLLLGLVASKLGGRLGIPGLVLFLGIGMLAGSEGPGGIDFENYPLTQAVGILTLAFILYSGGLETDWRYTRPVLRDGLLLATLGVVLTTGLVAVVAHALLALPWLTSILLGAVVSSTDASAVFSVLKERALGLKGRIRPMLEFESGVNDPMAVFLVIGLTSLIAHPGTPWTGVVPLFLKQMVLGGVIGLGMGRLAVRVFNRINLPSDGLYTVLSVALVGLVYASTALVGGSGFLAVYIAGVVLGNSAFVHRRSLRQWHEGLTYLLEIGMFLLLGLLVFPSKVVQLAVPSLLISLFLMFVARPVAVFVSLSLARVPTAHKGMVAWVGLRGAVPIILATFPLLEHVPGADTIFNVAFFIMLTSLLIQGTTLPVVARWLGVDEAKAARQNTQRLQFTPTGAGKNDLVEVVVPPDSRVVGQRIVSLDFPPEALILLIHRNGEYIVPSGSTVLEAGDELQMLGSPSFLDRVRARIRPAADSAT